MSFLSLGQVLLSGNPNTFDYVLNLTEDGKTFVKVHCHRCVLCACSNRFDNLIGGEEYFEMNIKLLPGYLLPMLELIQYMYLRDLKLISHKKEVLKLCGSFEMPMQHFTIRTMADPVFMRDQREIHVHLDKDGSRAVLGRDMLNTVKFLHSKIQVIRKIHHEQVLKEQPQQKQPKTLNIISDEDEEESNSDEDDEDDDESNSEHTPRVYNFRKRKRQFYGKVVRNNRSLVYSN